MVLQNPQSQIVLSGTSVEFSASAGSQSNGLPSGTKTGSLIVEQLGQPTASSSVQSSDAGEYFVWVTNGHGNVDSEQANLQVTSNSSLVALLEGGNRMVYQRQSSEGCGSIAEIDQYNRHSNQQCEGQHRQWLPSVDVLATKYLRSD